MLPDTPTTSPSGLRNPSSENLPQTLYFSFFNAINSSGKKLYTGPISDLIQIIDNKVYVTQAFEIEYIARSSGLGILSSIATVMPFIAELHSTQGAMFAQAPSTNGGTKNCWIKIQPSGSIGIYVGYNTGNASTSIQITTLEVEFVSSNVYAYRIWV